MQDFMARVNIWGLILLIVGAAAGFCSGKIAAKLFPDKKEKADSAIKIAGLAVVMVAALITMKIIG